MSIEKGRSKGKKLTKQPTTTTTVLEQLTKLADKAKQDVKWGGATAIFLDRNGNLGTFSVTKEEYEEGGADEFNFHERILEPHFTIVEFSPEWPYGYSNGYTLGTLSEALKSAQDERTRFYSEREATYGAAAWPKEEATTYVDLAFNKLGMDRFMKKLAAEELGIKDYNADQRYKRGEEYRARYRDEVEAELRAHEPYFKQELPAKGKELRADLQRSLVRDLHRKVNAMFPLATTR